MAICLVIDNATQTIVNRIVAEPTDAAPEGTRLLLWDGIISADIGWTWDGTAFVPPATETN